MGAVRTNRKRKQIVYREIAYKINKKWINRIWQLCKGYIDTDSVYPTTRSYGGFTYGGDFKKYINERFNHVVQR